MAFTAEQIERMKKAQAALGSLGIGGAPPIAKPGPSLGGPPVSLGLSTGFAAPPPVSGMPGLAGVPVVGQPPPAAPPPMPPPQVPSLMDVAAEGIKPSPAPPPSLAGMGLDPQAPPAPPSLALPPGAGEAFAPPTLGAPQSVSAPSGPAPMLPKPAPAPAPPPAFGGPAGPPPAPLSPEELLAKKKAAVLLPGQDAQFQNEQMFQASQLAKQNELDAIKVSTQEKLAAEQEGAVAAQSQALADEAAAREAFANYHDQQSAKLQASSDALANAKIDPQRMFKAQGLEGVLQGVMIAMSLQAGVAGASATGGQNAGVAALEKAIDKDILAQEKDLARQEAGLQRSNSLLAQKYRIFGDMAQAKAAARIDAWKLAGMRADAIAAKSGAASAHIGAEKIAEAGKRAIDRAGEDWNIGVEAKYAQMIAEQKRQAAAAAAAQQAKIDKYKDMIMATELEGAKEVLKDERYKGGELKFENNHVVIVDPTTGKRLWAGGEGGEGGVHAKLTVPLIGMDENGDLVQLGAAKATSPEAATKYQAVQDAKNNIMQITNDMKAMRKKNGGGVLWANSEEKALVEMWSRELYTAAKTVGENSDPDALRILKTVPNPLDLDPKASILGGKAYPDAMIDEWQVAAKRGLDRANKIYLKPGTAPLTPKQGSSFKPGPK